jgi:multidrug efflux system outer membrane protein
MMRALPEANGQNSIDLIRRAGNVVLSSLAAFFLLGCNVGPNYKRPATDLPSGYRSMLAPDISTSLSQASIAEEQWAKIFQDPVLALLVKEALAGNLDLQMAADRVLEARAQAGIVRSEEFPSVDAGGADSTVQLPFALTVNKGSGTSSTSFFTGGGPRASAMWNLDFWGLYRRQTEAARAELLASEWGQNAVRATLIQDVALAYFNLRALDEQRSITERTIQARKESLQLTQALEEHGAGSLADVRQAEELLHTAQANLPELRRQIRVEENTISVLLGRNPGSVDRGLPIDQQPHPLDVPVGVPSQLLERRPDIKQAEATLIAANARIGVARAQFFPEISLTSLGGAASNQLSSVLSGPSSYWYAAGSVTEPIFDAGRIRNNYRLSQAQEREMLINYRKTILSALRDVSDSLVSYEETRQRREEEAEHVRSAADAVRLARLRYSGGNASYIEVLTTDTDLYSAQLLLAQAQRQEASSLVQLYSALGGGWQ